jgi:hypothetical protein
MQMNTKFLMSCAALALLELGGAAIPTNAQATLRPDSLLKTTNTGAIDLTEHALVRNFGTVLGKHFGPPAAKVKLA